MKGLGVNAEQHGEKLVIIPIEHLQDCKAEINRFQGEEELNGFQRWIVEELYQFTVPKADFEIKAILLTALQHPAYAEVEFHWQGKRQLIKSLVMPDFDEARKRYSDQAEKEGYHLLPASNLPLKRLATQSGLAAYGRNNVTYIEGMGSYFSYDAYFTDLPSEEDHWGEVRHTKECKDCKICLKNCPTGAIRQERFLIDNQRCLSAMNEVPGEFPEWLPKSVHHTLYDCLRCQDLCPMNKPYRNDIVRGISFDEKETAMLLSGITNEEFPVSMKEKTKLLGLTDWLAAIPRNLSILLEEE